MTPFILLVVLGSVAATASHIGNIPDDKGVYGQWSTWSRCSKRKCGIGWQTRSRTCEKLVPSNWNDCSSKINEKHPCMLKPCLGQAVDGGLTEWSTFGKCSKPCNGGTKERTRNCTNPAPANGGSDCDGSLVEMEDCNKDTCPPDDGMKVRTACEQNSVTLQCQKGTIRINKACYGRNDRTTCLVKGNHQSLPINCCSKSSLHRVKERCQREKRCSVHAGNSLFGDPCIGTDKFLKVEFQCIE